MATPTRELSVVYGSTTLGAGTAYLIDGKVQIDVSYGQGTVSFDLVFVDSTEATFQTDWVALANALSLPRGRIQVLYGTHTHIDWNPATNSGFNQTASISKPGSQHDTGRSRRCRVTLTSELPYVLTASVGRSLVTSTNLQTTESGRLRLFLQGSYRALGGNGARQQYLAAYRTWVDGILAGFGGTWEGPFDQNESSDDANKNISFSQTWEELIFNQSVGTLDDPVLRRQRLFIRRLIEAPGDSPDHGQVARLETLTVEYDVAVDRAQTQDLVTVYQNRVLPFLLKTAKTVTQSSVIALVAQDPGYDFVENRLNVNLTILAAGNSNILSSLYRTDDSIDYGPDFVAVWNGDPMAKHDFQGPGRILRTITRVWRQLGGSSGGGTGRGASGSGNASGSTFSIGSLAGGGIAAGGFDFGTAGAGGDFVLNPPNQGQGGGGGGGSLDVGVDPSQVSAYSFPGSGTMVAKKVGENQTKIPLDMGRYGDAQIRVTDWVDVVRYEFFVPVAKSKAPRDQTVTYSGTKQGGADGTGSAQAPNSPNSGS